jgi:hypothetical protein
VVAPRNPVIDIFLEVKTHGLTSQTLTRSPVRDPKVRPTSEQAPPTMQAIIPLADTPSPSFPTAGNQVRARFILTCSQAAAAQTNLQQPEFRLGESKRVSEGHVDARHHLTRSGGEIFPRFRTAAWATCEPLWVTSYRGALLKKRDRHRTTHTPHTSHRAG